MLTKLRFQNWRSLQDVTIENLTPLTVLIGANSSGKTNIIDGLKFLREATADSPLQAIQNRRGGDQVRTVGALTDAPVEIEMFYRLYPGEAELDYRLGLKFNDSVLPQISEGMRSNGLILFEAGYNGVDFKASANILEFFRAVADLPAGWRKSLGWRQTALSALGVFPGTAPMFVTVQYLKERWQILDEGFNPPLSVIAGNYGDITVMDPDASNLPIMLHFLREAAPEQYAQLQEDLQLLMGYVGRLVTLQDDRETRFYIEEKHRTGIEAPTISAGTARLVAMLTAYYALDIGPRASMPGLVVIEEPDTALNPWILRDFVGFLRRAVEGEHPRQFILTTHNPALLDYFEPDEVRLVTRDEQGISHVQAIPEQLKTIWDDPIALGEVWMTNAFGDMPL